VATNPTRDGGEIDTEICQTSSFDDARAALAKARGEQS